MGVESTVIVLWIPSQELVEVMVFIEGGEI